MKREEACVSSSTKGLLNLLGCENEKQFFEMRKPKSKTSSWGKSLRGSAVGSLTIVRTRSSLIALRLHDVDGENRSVSLQYTTINRDMYTACSAQEFFSTPMNLHGGNRNARHQRHRSRRAPALLGGPRQFQHHPQLRRS